MTKSNRVIIGISSLASNGKTFLAREISKEFGIECIENSTAAIAKEHNLEMNIAKHNDFNKLQTKLAEYHFGLVHGCEHRSGFVSDRTIYDILMYAYCYFQDNEKITTGALNLVISYFLDTFKVYNLLILLPPIDDYKVIKDEKRTDDIDFQLNTNKVLQTINYLYPNKNVYIPKDNSSFESRNKEIIEYIKDNLTW